MLQLIVFIIFLLSVLGIAFILYKKIPVLVELPQNGHHGLNKPKFVLKIEKRVESYYLRFFKKKIPLHRLLSKIRVLVLKIETQIYNLLHGIRKKAQEIDNKKGNKK